MRTVTYHLATTATTFTAALAQLTIVRDGRIVGARISWCGIAGGGGTFLGQVDLSHNSQTTYSSYNDPPRFSTLTHAVVYAAAASAMNAFAMPYVPLSVPCKAGDVIYLNAANGGGAAPTTSVLTADLWVTEA
jgi:hypothetical protein